MDVRVLLAGILGVGLGIVMVAFPETVIHAHTAGRLPTDRSGRYGDDAASHGRWRSIVRVIGVAVIGFGIVFLWRGLA